MKPPPATPELCGSTRPSIAWMATAASAALPPLRRISAPASAAKGLAATTKAGVLFAAGCGARASCVAFDPVQMAQHAIAPTTQPRTFSIIDSNSKQNYAVTNPRGAALGSQCASVTATEVTADADEPIHSHCTNCSTASGAPQASTSTRPSARLRA